MYMEVAFYRTDSGGEPVRDWVFYSRDNARRSWRIDMSRHVGSRLDDFLDEEGLLAESEAVAVKRVVAYQLREMMKEQGLSKTALARRMKTSRAALERLLDPENASVTLLTLERAARALGMRIKIELAAA